MLADQKRQKLFLETILKAMDGREKVLTKLKEGIASEVEKNTNTSTLFRENTFTTRAMVAVVKMIGEDYLQEIRPIIEKLSRAPRSVEIDAGSLQVIVLVSFPLLRFPFLL